VKHSDEDFSVELGVAGFDKKEISLTKEKNQLIIEGKKEEKDEREFVHKSLATRSFKRSFTLADDIVIDSAHIENGILSIQLVREIPEEDKPLEIKIS
jgi:molecular chaperone IbpA